MVIFRRHSRRPAVGRGLIGGVGDQEVCPLVRVSLYSYLEDTIFNTFKYISVLCNNQYYTVHHQYRVHTNILLMILVCMCVCVCVCVLHVPVCVLSFEHLSR
jgi:hypothetical protein